MTLTAPRRALLTAAGGLLLAAADDPNPDAAVWIEEVRVGLFGRTGSIGGGRLRFRGQEHRFSIEGLSAASSGLSTVRAQGEVFGLRRIEDFAGTYTQVPAGGPGGGPVMVYWLRNARSVRLRLRSARSGSALQIGAGGLVIALED